MNPFRLLRSRAVAFARANPAWKFRAFRTLNRVGYDTGYWCRKVMYDTCFADIRDLGPENLDVLEISAGYMWNDEFDGRFRSYRSTDYPEFDICADIIDDQKFDLIIADQVFEHLRDPAQAAKNVHSMLKPGGRFLVLTPFLIGVHPVPLDLHRWTEQGLQFFLADNGFEAEGIRTASWGNRKAVKANLSRFPRVGFGRDLTNEPAWPLVVWAWARA